MIEALFDQTKANGTRLAPLPADDESLISAGHLTRAVGVSRTTWWRWVRAGIAPKAIMIGPRTARYQVGDVRRFIAERKGAANV